MVKHQIIMGIA